MREYTRVRTPFSHKLTCGNTLSSTHSKTKTTSKDVQGGILKLKVNWNGTLGHRPLSMEVWELQVGRGHARGQQLNQWPLQRAGKTVIRGRREESVSATHLSSISFLPYLGHSWAASVIVQAKLSPCLKVTPPSPPPLRSDLTHSKEMNPCPRIGWDKMDQVKGLSSGTREGRWSLTVVTFKGAATSSTYFHPALNKVERNRKGNKWTWLYSKNNLWKGVGRKQGTYERSNLRTRASWTVWLQSWGRTRLVGGGRVGATVTNPELFLVSLFL